MAITAAKVNMEVIDSGDWSDAFQLGTPGDTSWSFTGGSFHMDVKGSTDDAVPLLSLTTANGYVVIDDPVNRILHLAVPQSVLEAALIPGRYVYDLVLISAAGVRTPLMYGWVKIKHGATQE
jgi:hypothetical protein